MRGPFWSCRPASCSCMSWTRSLLEQISAPEPLLQPLSSRYPQSLDFCVLFSHIPISPFTHSANPIVSISTDYLPGNTPALPVDLKELERSCPGREIGRRLSSHQTWTDNTKDSRGNRPLMERRPSPKIVTLNGPGNTANSMSSHRGYKPM